MTTSPDLLEIARATGLRGFVHGVNAEDVRVMLQRFVDALPGPVIPTDAQIVEVWQGMPGGADGWLKGWGFIQFSRALLERFGTPPLDPNHRPDLHYILGVLERLAKQAPKDAELAAALNGMRYVVKRTDAAAAQRHVEGPAHER